MSYRNYKVYIEGDNSFPDKVKRVGIGNVRFTRYGQELFDLLQSSRTVPLPRYGEDKDGKPSFSSASYDSLSLAADPSLELSYLVAPPRMAYYEKVSRQIYGIYSDYSACGSGRPAGSHVP